MASVLLHIPHASMQIPEQWASIFYLKDQDLRRELIAMTDSYTDELFASGHLAEVLRFPVSRLLVDPERFLPDDQEPMSCRGIAPFTQRRTMVGI